jgi:hypothetical protein
MRVLFPFPPPLLGAVRLFAFLAIYLGLVMWTLAFLLVRPTDRLLWYMIESVSVVRATV